ncbi:MAG: hypothetical protein IPM71_10180 [Bacteroidota bacterium]|nr:MAG: hypothetical protein IPM71_10180 [Bacteroidota bacterium]
MKKFRKIAVWTGLLAYFILISGFVSSRRENVLCGEIKVVVSDSAQNKFVAGRDITLMLERKLHKVLGLPIEEVNTDTIEKIILTNSLIHECKVYTTSTGSLTIEINQREPVLRIIDSKGMHYYIDCEGTVLSTSARFTPHLLVANGYIKTPFETGRLNNIFDSDFEQSAKTLRELFELSNFIQNNTFWNAQIVQLYVNRNKEYELIPRVGPHIILLGPLQDYEAKFDKLQIFYKEGLNQVGWNQYLYINLKFKDQIVCSKNTIQP